MGGALGVAGVSLGLGASVLGCLTLVVALVRHRPHLLRFGRIYAYLVFAGGVLAFIAMEIALFQRDFSLAYVAQVGSTKTPPLFNFAALWSSLEGSILLWSLILGGYVVAVVWRFRRRLQDPLVGWALVTLFVICTFFFLLMFGPANPFKEVAGAVPLDGPGPNPLLQNHVLMAFHPPILYLGYVGFSVPFAFAIGALVTGRVGEGWLLATRRWTLLAWGFLTVGIILGAWWSYEVLGWGGYWAWDPVENASFLPWLTGTAFIHSVLVQERRGMLRVWNLALLCATFSLTILGTFLTRSGILDSVHAFSDSTIGPWLLTFFGLVVAVSIGLIGWRGDRLRSPGTIDSPISREGTFLANNVLFAVVRVRRAARHRLPVDRRGAARSEDLGRAAVLRADDAPARPCPPHADGDRAGAPLAQGVRGAAPPPAALAGVDRRRLPPGRRPPRRAGSARSWPSGSAGSPPGRRCASSCWRRAVRACGAWSDGPTGAWWCTSA